MDSDIPMTYEQWRRCITVKCKITLTRHFLERRIAALRDPRASEVVTFSQRYGEAYWRAVLGWYERALAELAQPN